MDLLQEYVYIPLDVFQKIVQNKGVRNKLKAWLMFFSTDEPEKMAELGKGDGDVLERIAGTGSKHSTVYD